ncbi:MAG: ribosome-associated translation inhibitor RaiA [Tepidisphaeraceae bacterium]
MLVTISSRHMDVSAPLKAYAEQKASKLTRYYDRIQDIEVIFDNARNAMRVEIIVGAERRKRFIAHDSNSDAYACIDTCVGKLERQLSDHKKKFRNRKHSVGEDKREMRGAAARAAATPPRRSLPRNQRK